MILNVILAMITLFTWEVYGARRLVQHTHMAQQNSYRPERYMRWFKPRKKENLLTRDLVATLALVVSVLAANAVAGDFAKMAIWIFTIAVAAILNLSWKRPVEKKPLAWTDRAKRLFACACVFFSIDKLLVVILAVFVSMCFLPLLGIMAYLIPIYMYGSVLVREPFENRRNQAFVDDAARIIKEMPRLTTIGVTGSYGKTSSKVILGRILSENYNTLITPDSYNTPMGITITTRNMLKPIHDVFVAEMGARQKGDIAELCDIVQPKIGIVTAIGPQHLETFGNIETVADTKFELIDSLPLDGLAVLNMDDENIVAKAKSAKCNILTYGLERSDVDYTVVDIGFSPAGMSFVLKTADGKSQEMRTKLLGKHNIYNILAAAAVALHLGMTLAEVARAVAQVPPVEHRLVMKPAGNYYIIDDAFNSNPAGAKMAVEVLAQMPNGRKIIITPGMVELGSAQYDKNKEFAINCAQTLDYVIIVGKKHSQALQDGVAEVGLAADKFYVAEDLNDALAHMRAMVQRGDYVLLENDLPDSYL